MASRGARVKHDILGHKRAGGNVAGVIGKANALATALGNTALIPTEPAAVAPCTPVDPNRARRIHNAGAIERCLKPHGVTITSQADRRNLDKLADKRPTIGQIDGACNMLLAMEGHIDLGRLVAKWDHLREETAKRPAGWTNWSQAQRDKFDEHVTGGGDPYTFNETQRRDYGV